MDPSGSYNGPNNVALIFRCYYILTFCIETKPHSSVYNLSSKERSPLQLKETSLKVPIHYQADLSVTAE